MNKFHHAMPHSFTGPADKTKFIIKTLRARRTHQTDIGIGTSFFVYVSQKGFHQFLPNLLILIFRVNYNILDEEYDSAVPYHTGNTDGPPAVVYYNGEKSVLQRFSDIRDGILLKMHFFSQGTIDFGCQSIWDFR